MQQRLRNEIRAHLPNPTTSDAVEPTQLDRLAFLHACIKETMRLYPGAPRQRRVTARHTMIAGHAVPPGVLLALCSFATHRSRSHFGSDALTFNPDRWLSPLDGAKGGASSTYSYMPFLHGPRRCPGGTFAIAQIASMVAGLIGNFDVWLEDGTEKVNVETEYVLCRPTHEPRIKLQLLSGW